MKSISPTGNPYFELMAHHLMDVAIELFAAYDLPIEHCPALAGKGLGPETYCMASIGYVGRGVKGVLILAATRAAAEAWTSAAGGMDCDLVDAVGEFSNMLLGRLKGRLLREGIPISPRNTDDGHRRRAPYLGGARGIQLAAIRRTGLASGHTPGRRVRAWIPARANSSRAC